MSSCSCRRRWRLGASIRAALLALVVLRDGVRSHQRGDVRYPDQFAQQPLIIDGEDVEQLDFTWITSLQVFNKRKIWWHVCSGSLISNQHILTAAHCVEGRFGLPWRVVLGKQNLETPFTKDEFHMRPEQFILDELWSRSRRDYDFSLVKLRGQLNFFGAHRSLSPIRLPEKDDFAAFDNSDCRIAGWGFINKNATKPWPRLQMIHTRVLPWKSCQQTVGPEIRRLFNVDFTRRMLCAKGERGLVWVGDSGGSLECKRDGHSVLVGILSFGFTEKIYLPPVYAHVSERVEWIKAKMSQ
ncbi:chymotrypsin elastase family member 3B-like [Tropilaelaps mercedesae]|uniref:Chymotrypsin elastase family member 3B-like n=1 Tax=Tropilaelaps mercedesae TaxID=418985 RepID=A0A1V9XTC0_9ACAR|nr:chymotrypsin elastase family member 3B-like [Tropilaelaps mercedesae]